MLPFRIVKDDDGENPGEGNHMLDFRRMFKIEAPEAAVLAIVVPKTDEETEARIVERGFSVENKQDLNDAVAYIQEEGDLEADGNATIQFSPDLAAVVRLKYFEPYGDSKSFTENLEKNGFLPGFDMSLSVLRDTVFNSLFDAENQKDASGTIDTAIKEFRSHIANMTAALPESAFKLDPGYLATKEAVEKGVKEFNVTINIGPETSVGAPSITNVDATQTEGGEEVAVNPAVSGSSSSLGKEDQAVVDAEKVLEDAKTAAKAATEGGDDAAATDTDATDDKSTAKADSHDGNVDTEKDSKSESDTADTLKQITESLGLLAADIKKTSTAVEGVVEQVGTLNERVEEVAATAKKTDEDINGTVNAGSSDDPDNSQSNEGDAGGEPDLIDTGWESLTAAH
jgi:hypothetical protein